MTNIETDLTVDELIARWRGEISRGALANWRAQRKGPPWRKIGRVVLYPIAGVIEYENSRIVTPDPVPQRRSLTFVRK